MRLRPTRRERQIAFFPVAEDHPGNAHHDHADCEQDVEHGVEPVVERVAGEDRTADSEM